MSEFEVIEAEFEVDQRLLVVLTTIEQVNELAADLRVKAVVCEV